MDHGKETYDEEAELTEYVWHNYSHLLSKREYLAATAILADQKAESSSPRLAEALKRNWGSASDPQFADFLAGGNELFRKRVRERILGDCANEVFINRCAKCDRIVATPRAKQCLWCGHDWH
jgi:hypothetical protein